MSKEPLYVIIYKDIFSKIKSGEFQKDHRLPTEMEISKNFNVSRITVTRALKELEQGNYIRRIKGSGSYVNDSEIWKTSQSNIETGTKLSIISLVLPFEGNFSFDIFKGIEDVAKKKNYLVTFHNSSDDPKIEREIILDLVAKQSHGIILYPVEHSDNMDLYSNLLIDKFPFVLLDKKIHGIDAPLVWADNEMGSYEITSHLIELGHTKIVFAGTSVYDVSSELSRYNGFCKAHVSHGLPLQKKHLFTDMDLNSVPSDYHPDEPLEVRQCNYIIDFIESIPASERPTAITAVNDQMAEVIMRTAISRGIKIPEDYSITGFDNLPFSSHLPVPLTTVEQPVYKIGNLAAEELFKKIQFPGMEVNIQTVKAKLLIRKSTGKPKK
ncbi:MAG: GntR family transcriptional regulator [Spirochaetaceae bacterium]